MGRRVVVVGTLLLSTLCTGLQGLRAEEEMVGVSPSDGLTMFVKQFSVAAGGVITGVEFRNNDARTVFPEVLLARGVSSAMNEGTVVARAANVSETSGGWARVTWAQSVQAADGGNYYVGVRLPEGSAKQGPGDGPGVGATRVALPVGSYVATGSEGTLTPTLIDLAINLTLTGGASASKSGTGQDAGLRLYLSGARPNPFNPNTTLEFGVREETDVRLEIYDVAGREVRSLAHERVSAGTHRRAWDGRDDRGVSVAAGIYVVQLIAGSETFREKIVLVK